MTLDRIRTILGAAVTWLVTAAAILTILIGELGSIAGVPAEVVQLLGTALVIVTAAITIIRRVTPVLPTARGLLPPPAGVPETARELELLRVNSGLRHPAGVDPKFPGEFA